MVSVQKGRLPEGLVWSAERNLLTTGAPRMGEAKARKLFVRGGKLIYDEMHNHRAIFALDRTYQQSDLLRTERTSNLIRLLVRSVRSKK